MKNKPNILDSAVDIDAPMDLGHDNAPDDLNAAKDFSAKAEAARKGAAGLVNPDEDVLTQSRKVLSAAGINIDELRDVLVPQSDWERLDSGQLEEMKSMMSLMDAQGLALKMSQRQIDSLNTMDERDEEIAASLEPISLQNLILRGYVTQEVPAIPGSVTVRYRSLTDTSKLLGIHAFKMYVKALPKPLKEEAEDHTRTVYATIYSHINLVLGVEALIIEGREVSPWAHALRDILTSLSDSTPSSSEVESHWDRCGQMVIDNMVYWSDRSPLASELNRQQVHFVTRTQNIVRTMGVGFLTKKS